MATKIRIQISPDELNKSIRGSVKEIEQSIRKEVRVRANSTMADINGAVLVVLMKRGTGKKYGKHRASSPGQAPVVKSGSLKETQVPFCRATESTNGFSATTGVGTVMKYAPTMEYGFDGQVSARRGKNKKYKSYRLTIEPRPYVERTKKKALVKINERYRRPYR